MLQVLLTSKVRVGLLTLLLMNPEREYYLKGLVRELGANNNALRRELGRLEKIGLLRSERRGGARYFSVNRRHPLFPELKGLVLKTTGMGQALRDRLGRLGSVECAFVYGSVARGEEDRGSDVDLLVVGEVDLGALRGVLQELEGLLGREINDTVYGREEFIERRNSGDAFLERVMQGPKIVLVGTDDALE